MNEQYREVAEILNSGQVNSDYVITLAELYIKSYKGIKQDKELGREYEPALVLLSIFFKDQLETVAKDKVIKSEKADTHSIEYAVDIKKIGDKIPNYIKDLLDSINSEEDIEKSKKDLGYNNVRGY